MRGPRKPFTLDRVFSFGGLFLALLVGVFLLTLFLGERFIAPGYLFKGDPTELEIFWSLRLPHAFLAGLVGAGLAASGTTLQGVMRNPLADPFVLGVSGGAALGATLAIALGLGNVGELVSWLAGGTFLGPWLVGLAHVSAPALGACVGAVTSMGLVLAAGRGQGSRAPYVVLLTGVIFNTFASAIITLLKTLSDPQRTKELLFWLSGSLGEEHASTLTLAALVQAVALGVMLAQSGRLNLLMLGDEDALSLGVDVPRTRGLLLLAASASVGCAVVLSGLVGFVGLIVPHVLRLVFGPDQRLLVPLSALGGAGFLLGADALARMALPLFHNNDVPVGAVTAILGGPLFLVLLLRRSRLILG